MTQKQSLACRFEHNTFLLTFQCPMQWNQLYCYLIRLKNWTLTTKILWKGEKKCRAQNGAPNFNCAFFVHPSNSCVSVFDVCQCQWVPDWMTCSCKEYIKGVCPVNMRQKKIQVALTCPHLGYKCIQVGLACLKDTSVKVGLTCLWGPQCCRSPGSRSSSHSPCTPGGYTRCRTWS